MKQLLQVIADLFSIAMAAGVLGGAYIYTNPDQAAQLLDQWQAWLTLPTLPTFGPADLVLGIAIGCGLVSTIVLFTRGKTLLRGPVKVTFVR